MHTYTVIWTIELDASSFLDAAQKALAIQRNPDSIATAFEITDDENDTVTIDFNE